MRMRTRSRNSETLPPVVQEIRGTKEGAEEEGGVEKHENGEPTRGSKNSDGHARIRGENRKVQLGMINRTRDQ